MANAIKKNLEMVDVLQEKGGQRRQNKDLIKGHPARPLVLSLQVNSIGNGSPKNQEFNTLVRQGSTLRRLDHYGTKDLQCRDRQEQLHNKNRIRYLL
jgi:hypothetical protein